MWPLGHLATGYLLLTSITRLCDTHPPTDVSVVLLALGTQFPDLIDKPAAYWLALLPEGRSLAHSLLFALPLCAAAGYVSSLRGDRRIGFAFIVGYLSHLAGDALPAVREEGISELTFLLWPILPLPEYSTHSFTPHVQYWISEFQRLSLHVLLTEWRGDFFVFQQWITLVAALTWIVDGRPGLGLLYRAIRTMINFVSTDSG